MADIRVGPESGWHHVMHRGPAGRRLFPSPEDAAEFLGIVAELSRLRPVEIHAYCIMGNHYHLLIRAPERDLGDALDLLEEVYTQRVRVRHGGAQRLFQEKRRVLPVQRNRHLLLVSRYIHRNPVEAGLVARPEDWRHSSFASYVNPALAPPWLKTAAILGAFGSIGARQRYRRFVDAGLQALGTSMEEGGSTDPDRGPALAAVARALAQEFSVPPGEIRLRPGGRTARGAILRGAMLHVILGLPGPSLRRVAAWLGYRSPASALRAALRFRQAVAADRRLAQRLRAVMERLRSNAT